MGTTEQETEQENKPADLEGLKEVDLQGHEDDHQGLEEQEDDHQDLEEQEDDHGHQIGDQQTQEDYDLENCKDVTAELQQDDGVPGHHIKVANSEN